jgi:hypothetical protein
MDNVLIRFVGMFDKTIPDFFEEVWSLTALSDNEVEDTHYVKANEYRHQYYTERGSTQLTAWSRENRDDGTFIRNIQIEYEDRLCNWYQMVLNHSTADGKYRIAMPLVPTLEGPFDQDPRDLRSESE